MSKLPNFSKVFFSTRYSVFFHKISTDAFSVWHLIGLQAMNIYEFQPLFNLEIIQTRKVWQSLAYSPLGAALSPPSEYL